MKKMIGIAFALLLVINPTLFAQDAQMADTMRADGKIYVVVAIIVVIFGGLIALVAMTDRKITALEKRKEK
jgi:hypothetical protein